MAKHIYSSNLSAKSINKLRKDLIKYRDKYLPKKCRRLVERLAEIGVDSAKAGITKLDAIFTGELLDSISAKDGGNANGKFVFYVVADSEHAVFVEFGTGQMGKEAPYPYPLPTGVNWEYNTGKTIFEITPGEYGWFYPKDGKWYFTQGMPSRPFMYEASMDMITSVVKVAREVFR